MILPLNRQHKHFCNCMRSTFVTGRRWWCLRALALAQCTLWCSQASPPTLSATAWWTATADSWWWRTKGAEEERPSNSRCCDEPLCWSMETFLVEPAHLCLLRHCRTSQTRRWSLCRKWTRCSPSTTRSSSLLPLPRLQLPLPRMLLWWRAEMCGCTSCCPKSDRTAPARYCYCPWDRSLYIPIHLLNYN